MDFRTFVFGFCILFVSHVVEAANILGIFTMNSPSHNIIHISVVRALADAGHNVTVVTMLPLKDKNPNYKHIYIPLLKEDEKHLSDMFHDMAVSKSKIKAWGAGSKALSLMNDIQQKALKESAYQELLNNKGNHFDLLILGFGYNDYLLGIGDHFKCPIIVTWVNNPVGPVNSLVGNPDGVSYVPLPWFGDAPMGFFQRVGNFLMLGMITGMMALMMDSKLVGYHKDNFPPELGYRSLEEMRKNVSLVFCSTFFSEGPIRPYTPNFIEIGGIQAKEKPDPLQKDVDDFVQSAQNGVIFFSLGSNLKSADISANINQALFNILSARKERILWKWDSSSPPGNASNIMFRKWFAQDDILAHPKTKLFITHAGKGSVTEAQYHGVPMLAIPVFGDQLTNANAMQMQGYGLVVDQHEITEETLKAKLDEVIGNASYSEAVKRYSTLYRDRPMTSRQNVVYWTEYVLRHHGAKHMQSPRVHLNSFQYNCLDVIGFLLAVILSAVFIFKHALCYIKTFLCHKSISSSDKKTK